MPRENKTTRDSHHKELSLFSQPEIHSQHKQQEQVFIHQTPKTPWAHALRPKLWEDYVGQNRAKAQLGASLNGQGIILWGPSGCGKTTLAHLLAQKHHIDLSEFSAVLNGIPELRKLIQSIEELKKIYPRKSFGIFIDEIHRFNRAQQDALLPYVEKGNFFLFGATTENPRVAINRALLSRCQVIELNLLSLEEITLILERTLKLKNKTLPSDLLQFIAEFSNGDARRAINGLQITLENEGLDEDSLRHLILEQSRHYDQNGNRHYDVISAFIKSMRASDPQAAMLYLAIMIDGGEDPLFIARRLIVFASEDIGNADPQALILATSSLTAVQNIGMPEARIILAQATTYLANAPKSNACYQAINKALEFVQNRPTIAIPDNFTQAGKDKYVYPPLEKDKNKWGPTTSLNNCPIFYQAP